jgi:hypothetical protein
MPPKRKFDVDSIVLVDDAFELTCASDASKVITLKEGRNVLGRQSFNNDIRISRSHCALEVDIGAREVTLTRLGANPLFVIKDSGNTTLDQSMLSVLPLDIYLIVLHSDS